MTVFKKAPLGAFVVAFTFLLSCNNAQSDAMKQQEATLKTMQETSVGEIKVSSDGYQFSCEVDGELFKAKTMADVNETGRVIGYIGQEYIALPFSRNAKEGKVVKIGEMQAIDINLESHPGLSTSQTGEIVITSVDEKWMTATFHMTLKSADGKTTEITNGSYRVPVSNR